MINFCITPTPCSNLEKLASLGATSFAVGTSEFADRQLHSYSPKDLKALKAWCAAHKINMNVFVNRMFEEKELGALRKHLELLKELDVDGIYFSDMGVFTLAKQLNMHGKCFYDPGMMVTNGSDAQIMIDLGCKGAVAASELTLDEILIMASECDYLEVMIHGRQNMCYSKRHLLTNYFRFIGKDESLAKEQNLTLMETTRNEKMPVLENRYGTSVYTPYTLASFHQIKALRDAGVKSFRIDSLFLSEEETEDALAFYQAVLNERISADEALEKMRERYPEQNYSDGYYEKKTNLTKQVKE